MEIVRSNPLTRVHGECGPREPVAWRVLNRRPWRDRRRRGTSLRHVFGDGARDSRPIAGRPEPWRGSRISWRWGVTIARDDACASAVTHRPMMSQLAGVHSRTNVTPTTSDVSVLGAPTVAYGELHIGSPGRFRRSHLGPPRCTNHRSPSSSCQRGTQRNDRVPERQKLQWLSRAVGRSTSSLPAGVGQLVVVQWHSVWRTARGETTSQSRVLTVARYSAREFQPTVVNQRR